MLTATQAHERFGYSRSSLLRYEERGLLHPQRTPGGHRRYNEVELSNLHKQNGSKAPETPKPHLDELGVSGLRAFGGSIWQERLRELRGLEGRILLREMRLNDPVIAAVFAAIEKALLHASWRVAPASEKQADLQAAEFLETCLHDMSFTWYDTVEFILQMLEQGFSVLEIVYKRRDTENSMYTDGRVGWRKLAPRPAESILEWDLDESGGIQGIKRQEGARREIPIERMLLFRTTVAPANSPEGLPIHRAMYTSWWFSQNIAEIEGIGVERDLAGIPVVYLGYDCTLAGEESDWELARNLVVNLRNDEQAGVVLPKPKLGTAAEGQGMLLELLSTGGRRQHDTSAIIERYDRRKALSVLAQFIMLGMEKVGSYALSRSQNDLFTLSVSGWLNHIASVFNRHGVPRLFRYNHFPGTTGLPRLVPSEIGIPDLATIADYVNKLRGAEVLRPDAELERHLRQLARLPERPATGEVEPTPDDASAGETLAEQAALLRRISLAAATLSRMGAISSQEAIDLLQAPLTQLRRLAGTTTRTEPQPTASTEKGELGSARIAAEQYRQAAAVLARALEN